ncbi:hypothetical protein E3T39_12915 [Cryobacterium suzukii]|uniref:Tetrahydrofolate dehydrogenase/cyclohydrolase catalytic domain-containing protein n=2 Tax=Cryobacterium suzukii TaxID=1259198 RepID=A0A4R9ACY7_9MICO|nr:hypothetical protein E3T39_12915 [Cryobacterium suzukii]
MDGTGLAEETFARITEGAAQFLAVVGQRPCLVTVLVGDDPSSHVYVRMKANRSGKVGIESRRIDLPQTTTTEELVAVLKDLSDDRSVDGILLQHPVPGQIDERAAYLAEYACFADDAICRVLHCQPGDTLV